ncbi:MAG: hypothetical protein KAS29_04285 [Bacteroidales bacterium]|nr:hypothetical protein [Bacteroidales bacterium]
MRKLLVITAFLLFAGIAFGQTLMKGNLIGVHVMSVELKPGATMDQFIDFFNEKAKPAWENAHKGMKVFLIKGLRGENVNEIGMLFQFKDEAARNKSYNDDGSLTEFGEKMQEKMAPIVVEAEKIGTWTTKYTDWLLL